MIDAVRSAATSGLDQGEILPFLAEGSTICLYRDVGPYTRC